MKLPFTPVFISILLILNNTGCNIPSSTEEQLYPLTTVVHPEWSRSATLYEVNIRQYTPEGTFNAFATHLERLKELGVDILWLMPVHPIGIKNRKGPLGSYYSVKDYRGINPEFGTLEDFKQLVRQTHQSGMRLIIDWVPNHSSWDNQLVTEHPEWYAKDSSGQMFSPWDWTDVVQFDYNQKGLRNYMINSMKYWLTETGIDGFRCDVAHQVPVDFWNEVRPALQEVKPDVLLVAEAEQRNLHEHAFDITYAWEFHHLMNEIAQGHQSVKAIDNYFTRSDTLYNPNDMRMYFTSNHDENSWNGTVFERLGKAAETMAVLSFTIPGIPLIYNGQEAGLNHRLKFFEKDQIVWRTHPFEKLYQRLNQLKEKEAALWNPGFGGTYTRLATENDSSLLAFIRSKGNNRVVCLFNLTDQSQNGSLTEIKGNFHDYFSGEHWKSNVFTLEPWGYRVLVKK